MVRANLVSRVILIFCVNQATQLLYAAQETAPTGEREWRLIDGNRISGTFESFDAGSKTVRIRASEKEYELRINDFSSEDREYLRTLTAASEPAPEVTPEPPEKPVEINVVTSENFNTPGTHAG